MANPPDFLFTLGLETEHIFAHYIVGEGGGVLKIRGDLAAMHDDQTVG